MLPGIVLTLLLAGPAVAQTAIPRVHGGRSLVLVRGDRPAEIDDPSDVATTTDGGILIVDEGKDDALLYDANFVWRGHVRAWLSDDGLDDPVRAAVDGRGVAWIAEKGARALRLVRDGRDGGRLGRSGEDPGEFGRIDDLAIDLDNHVYAVDSDRDRVQIFTPDGLLERIVRGFGDTAFEKPVLVAVDPGRPIPGAASRSSTAISRASSPAIPTDPSPGGSRPPSGSTPTTWWISRSTAGARSTCSIETGGA